MASVRKRKWISASGTAMVAWLVDYRDGQGKRRAKQFDRKKDADKFASVSDHEVRHGVHTADSQSITVGRAGELWLARGKREGLEQSTLNAYGQHVRLHIDPYLGGKRLNQLTKPAIVSFRDTLLDSGRSKAMVARVLRSLSSIVAEAERVGSVAQNVARGVTLRRGSRDKPKIVPPTKAQIKLLIETARARGDKRPMDLPMLLVLIFAGLRASEVRGLVWRNVDMDRKMLTVDQRADFKNVIGPPKSASGRRTIPVPDMLVAELKVWKGRCPPSHLDLVFPSQEGTPIFHPNIVLGFQEPLQIAAGVTRLKIIDGKTAMNEKGKAIVEGLFSMHDFRHAAASLWIERRVAPKRVQVWMGHSSIQMTFDTYGHLFAAMDDDAATMAALEADMGGVVEVREAA